MCISVGVLLIFVLCTYYNLFLVARLLITVVLGAVGSHPGLKQFNSLIRFLYLQVGSLELLVFTRLILFFFANNIEYCWGDNLSNVRCLLVTYLRWEY